MTLDRIRELCTRVVEAEEATLVNAMLELSNALDLWQATHLTQDYKSNAASV